MATRFSAIKEAYEILTDPVKKEYYLQQRWYLNSIGIRKPQAPVTPVSVLKQSIELERYVSRLNHYRMDREGLTNYILHLLSDEVIEQLQPFNDRDITGKILNIVLKTSSPLNTQQAQQVCLRLQKLTTGHEQLSKEITRFLLQHRQKIQLEKFSPVLIAILTIIICFLIFFAG